MIDNIEAVGGVCDVVSNWEHYIVIYRGAEVLFHGKCGQASAKDVDMFCCDTEQEMLDEIESRGLVVSSNEITDELD